MKPIDNVSIIIKDHKEAFFEEHMMNEIHQTMPRDNVFANFILDDMHFLICLPNSMSLFINEDLVLKMFELAYVSEGFEGFFWDGEQLYIIEEGKLYTLEGYEDKIKNQV